MSSPAAAHAVPARLSDAVHRHSPVPLHHQIKMALLQGIEQGWLPRAERLPCDRDLANALRVSLAPVRQAMHELTREGYLERTRGRGTFVADSKLVEKISIVGSFHSSIARQGLRLILTVITNDIVAAPAEVSEALALPSAKAWYLRRLAIVEGEPVALLDAWLPKELARGVKQLDLGERSLYEALADVHKLEMTSAENLVEVQRASTEEATLLELPPGSQLLRVSGVTRDRARDPVEFADVRYRPDRFKIAVESAAAPRSRPQRRS